jgi:glycosyltransferase involved in cell wall biosynthesis
MKLLFVSHLFPNSKNITNGVYNLARVKSLQRLGHDVVVIAPVGLTPPLRFIYPKFKLKELLNFFISNKKIPYKNKIHGVTVYHPKWFWLPKRPFEKFQPSMLRLCAGKIIKAIILDFSPDAVITSWLNPEAYYLKYIKKYYKGNTISILEGSDIFLETNNDLSTQHKLLELKLNVNKIISVSHTLQQYLKSKFDIDSTCIHNGFRTDLFYFTKIKEHTQTINLLTIGNLLPVKGHDLLLEAMRILGNKYELTIIGDGPLKNRYAQYIKKNNLEKRVFLKGAIANHKLKNEISKSDVFCLPSRSEGFGIVVLEAMACGVPVVAASVGGLSEIIIKNFNGLLCEPENPHILAETIQSATEITWDNSRISMWVKEHYGIEQWADRIMELVNEVQP